MPHRKNHKEKGDNNADRALNFNSLRWWPIIISLTLCYTTNPFLSFHLNGGLYRREGQKQAAYFFLTIYSGFFPGLYSPGPFCFFYRPILLRNLNLFRKISGILVFVLGLHLSGLIKINFLYREKGLELKSKNIYLRPLLMGLALAFAWTPCIGPILSSILIYAGTQEGLFQGGILLAFYSLGFALPFFLTALFLDHLLPRFKRLTIICL